MLVPLLWIALHATPPVDTSQNLQMMVEALKQGRRDEVHLLNQQLPPPDLDVWNQSEGRWRTPHEAEQPTRARLRVLHLWASWCLPCIRELPMLKKIVERSTLKFSKDEVQWLFISIEHSDEAMRTFLQHYGAILPPGPQYADTGALLENITRALPPRPSVNGVVERGLPGRSAPLPITIVLDEHDVVRLAFIGILEGRIGDLINGLVPLLRLTKGHPLSAVELTPVAGSALL